MNAKIISVVTLLLSVVLSTSASAQIDSGTIGEMIRTSDPHVCNVGTLVRFEWDTTPRILFSII